MEKKGVLLPLILAFFAASIYWWILSNKEKDIAKDFEMAQVLVAKYDLPARTVIKADLVETVEIPRRYIQKDAYEVRSAADIKMVVNLVSAIRIPKGNQVTQSALLALSPEAGLSVKVPPGLRGAVLPVDSDLLRLIKPGDRVDILVTFEAVMADGKKERVTATILQNVLVLGVGTNLGQGLNAAMAAAKEKQAAAANAFSDKGSLSLALNPIESQYLSLSQKNGDVSVVVRGLGDIEVHFLEMASFKKLIK